MCGILRQPAGFTPQHGSYGASQMAQKVKNPSAIQKTCVQSQSQEAPLEKGMATNSSILAWEISWPDESDGLQSTGSQRVGHDWVTKHSTASLGQSLRAI